jgi:flagellar assembly protein FliH
MSRIDNVPVDALQAAAERRRNTGRRRIVSSEDAGASTPWALPDVGVTTGVTTGTRGAMLTAGRMEQIQKEAYDEGFAQGLKEGRAAADQELARLRQQVDGLASAIGSVRDEIDQRVLDELSALAIAIARQLVRRQLHTDPGEIIHFVQEAINALPTASRDVKVRLHPEDMDLVRRSLGTDHLEGTMFVEDVSLSRGDCRVHTDISTVDGSLDARLNAVVATMIGGEREDDSGFPQ